MSVVLNLNKQRLIRFVLVFLFAFVCGCGSSPETIEKTADEPKQVSIQLHVAIEADAELERAIQRLRGEWQEFSGGTIETSLFKIEGNAESLRKVVEEADLIVFASRRLGELCEQNAIRPVRSSVLKNESLRFDDLLPLIRNEEIVYGKQTMALPIGCPTPLLVTQTEVDQIKLLLPFDWSASFEPSQVGPSQATNLAITYLAWAAPYVVHKGHDANLFDPGRGEEGFAASIAKAPFVKSLELLPQAVNFDGEPNAMVVLPCRKKFIEGASLKPKDLKTFEEVAPLGSSTENYNRMADAWEPLSERNRNATLVASSGRLISVTKSSRNAATAFRYAAWLVSPSNSRLLSTSSDQVANPRGSFARAADNWLAEGDQSLGRSISETLAKSLRSSRFMLVPRLPGGDRYLESLGIAVQRALKGEATAEEALSQCAEQWDQISQELGLAEQRAAYLRSIGATNYQTGSL